jgi:hypothetical protein
MQAEPLVGRPLAPASTSGTATSNSPSPKLCVSGEPTPTNIACAPIISLHVAPLAGSSTAHASTSAGSIAFGHRTHDVVSNALDAF